MAFVFATTGVKFPVFNFLPYGFYLVRYGSTVLWGYYYFFLLVNSVFIRLNKVESGTNGFPVFGRVIVNQDFVENGLSPLVAPIRIFLMWRFYFGLGFVYISRFIIYNIYAFAIKFDFI